MNRRFGITARDLSKKGGGTRTYIEEMLTALHKQIDDTDEIFIIHSEHNFIIRFPKFRHTIVKSHHPILFDQFSVPRWIAKNHIPMVIFPKNTVPLIPYPQYQSVVVFHDLGYFVPKLPAYTFWDRMITKRLMKIAAQRAAKIIAVSESTQQDIFKYLPIAKEKTTVIFEAVSSHFFSPDNPEQFSQLQKTYHLPKQYLLFTGGLSPRKNLQRTIQAFLTVRKEHSNLHLVLTGGFKKDRKRKKHLGKLIDSPFIHLLGFVPWEDLPFLYRHATAYLYPSLYEGFGLPILEAQASHCPVITSRFSSCAEVAGAGALLVDPKSTQDIEEALNQILFLDIRQAVIKKGIKNIKRFSWDQSACQLLNLIDKL